MPQGFGTLGADEIPIFTLPGNPVSAMVSFEVFVRPALRRMLGSDVVLRPQVTAEAERAAPLAAGRRSFLRGIVERTADGRLVARLGGRAGLPPDGGAGGMQRAAGRTRGSDRVEVGERVLALLLERRGR